LAFGAFFIVILNIKNWQSQLLEIYTSETTKQSERLSNLKSPHTDLLIPVILSHSVMFSKSYPAGPISKSLSIRSLRYQSHPLTRLVRDGIAPTLQSIAILLMGLCLFSLMPHLSSRIDFPIPNSHRSH
jgi:hypothetical protein